MNPYNYPLPSGVHVVPSNQLDSRPDAEIDHDVLNPRPITSIKNVWFFWHAGFANMHPYTQRNVRAWHRRFSKSGWTIRVLDRKTDSPMNIANFIDVNDPTVLPTAFIEGRVGGDYAPQHTSDLIRWPLLLKYGGVYADVGMMQIGDLDRLFNMTVGDPTSKYEVLSYCDTNFSQPNLTNYFLCSGPDNALFSRCHKLLLALWNADGGKVDTTGMHTNPLLSGVKRMSCPSFEDNGRVYSEEEAGKMLTDYIIQGSAITAVMGLVDEDDGWTGPEYCADHVYAVDFMVGSQLINEMTAWNGPRQLELMSLPLPKNGEAETDDQEQARKIVEACLSKSFGFKLATGMILKVLGQTLSSLWRSNPGADNIPGTYGHWLRYGIANWCQDELPDAVDLKSFEPNKIGRLLS